MALSTDFYKNRLRKCDLSLQAFQSKDLLTRGLLEDSVPQVMIADSFPEPDVQQLKPNLKTAFRLDKDRFK